LCCFSSRETDCCDGLARYLRLSFTVMRVSFCGLWWLAGRVAYPVWTEEVGTGLVDFT